LAKIKAEREAAQAKRKAEAEGTHGHIHSPLILSNALFSLPPSLPHFCRFEAKAAEIEAKKKAQLAKTGNAS
jgi:hypothetical protein